MELWMVTETNPETGAIRSKKWFYENEEDAKQHAKVTNEDTDWSAEVTKFYSEDHCDRDWRDEAREWREMYEGEEAKYKDLVVELEGLRQALDDAKAESERRINQALEELRVARSDVHTLEEVIVKLAMRLVGM